jgi:hypothetical protein
MSERTDFVKGSPMRLTTQSGAVINATIGEWEVVWRAGVYPELRLRLYVSPDTPMTSVDAAEEVRRKLQPGQWPTEGVASDER